MGARRRVLVHAVWSGLFISGLTAAVSPLDAQDSHLPKTVSDVHGGAQQNLSDLPDSPGTTMAKAEGPQGATPQSPSVSPGSTQATQPQSSGSQAQPTPQRPVGTAASEAPSASGVAASQPAGVAIAPAKQRRVRTIVLRTGAIIAAGVAVGSVVALTAATSSKPPGAH